MDLKNLRLQMNPNEENMLEINTGFKKGDAVTIVLDSMTEMVGRFVNDDDTTITLSSLRMVVPQTDSNGGIGISLQPVVFSSDDGYKAEMTFQRKNIVTTLRALKNIDDKLRQEESGLVMGQ